VVSEEMLDQFIAGVDSPYHSPESRKAWCRLFLRDMLAVERGPNNRLWDVVEESLNETRRRWVGTPPNADAVDAAVAGALEDVETRLAHNLKPLATLAPTVSTSGEPRSDRCIVCPHGRITHYERQGQIWCKACNKGGEVAGPCSTYFIPVHKFEPALGQPGFPECRICQLHEDGNAHRGEWVKE
jgi:hypothetical protein